MSWVGRVTFQDHAPRVFTIMPPGVPRPIVFFSRVFSVWQLLLLHDGLFVVVVEAVGRVVRREAAVQVAEGNP
jgi:hypothetical protein